MRYPLSDTEQYKGKIIFAPVQENYIDVPKTATSTVSEASNALSQFTSAATSTGSLSDTFGSGRKPNWRWFFPTPVKKNELHPKTII